MQSRSARRAAVAGAILGGLLGVVIVWLSRPRPPACTTLDDGMRACIPLHVVGPPPWLYVAAAVVGALLAGGLTVRLAGARQTAHGVDPGMGTGTAGRAGSSKDAALGRSVRSFFRRVR